MMKCVSCICLYLSLFKYAELHDCHLLAQYLWASPIVHRFPCEICYRKESIWVEVSCALPIACQQRWWCFSIFVENIAYWIYESNLSACWSGNKILWVAHHHFPHGWHASVCVYRTNVCPRHITIQHIQQPACVLERTTQIPSKKITNIENGINLPIDFRFSLHLTERRRTWNEIEKMCLLRWW